MLKVIHKKLDKEGKALAAIGLLGCLFGIFQFKIAFPLLFSILGGLASALLAAMIFGIISGIYYLLEDIFNKFRSNK